MTAIISILFGAGIALVVVLSALYHGWAVSLVWNWFVAPLGITKISVLHGFGLTLMANIFKGYKSAESKSKEQWQNDLVGSLLWPLIIVGMAWIAKSFL